MVDGGEQAASAAIDGARARPPSGRTVDPMYSPPSSPTSSRLRRAAPFVLLGLLGAGFAALGFWQLDRARWKARFLAEWSAALAAPPQPLAHALRDPAARIARVVGRGSWDAGATVLLDNQRVGDRVGVMVFTLFRDETTRRGVLVNRGFVPLRGDRRVPALPAPPAGDVTIAGLLRPPPSVGLALGNAEYVRGAPPPLLAWLDVPALARALDVPLDVRVLLLDPDADGGFERRWTALPNTLPPERHRGYALQWFALAGAVVAAGAVLWWRSAR
jgi:cytochrome oxidase assembly protein ShyY1